jgi:hypothetical protein
VGRGQFFGRDAADMQSIAIDLFHAADVENPNDLNRDGRVDAFDLQVIPVAGGGRIQPNVLRAITPQAGMPLVAAVVDEVVAEGDAAEAGAVFAPSSLGVGGYAGLTDERVAREETTDRDLAFDTFAATGADEPPLYGLFAALTLGRMTV